MVQRYRHPAAECRKRDRLQHVCQQRKHECDNSIHLSSNTKQMENSCQNEISEMETRKSDLRLIFHKQKAMPLNLCRDLRRYVITLLLFQRQRLALPGVCSVSSAIITITSHNPPAAPPHTRYTRYLAVVTSSSPSHLSSRQHPSTLINVLVLARQCYCYFYDTIQHEVTAPEFENESVKDTVESPERNQVNESEYPTNTTMDNRTRSQNCAPLC
ncbi:hypothetical protein Pelo_6392 [Pelomyxa schiedti]|nr:hypothetical protein Pelo_6392 [Pelomyxa schiedti]